MMVVELFHSPLVFVYTAPQVCTTVPCGSLQVNENSGGLVQFVDLEKVESPNYPMVSNY